mmetsp:Transcript_62053/g.161184  ORF Transcript_62053/g.161184 Transcript_62053/m.161184 type:complete len:241 (-) Transcript_62053:449-1171(-)
MVPTTSARATLSSSAESSSSFGSSSALAKRSLIFGLVTPARCVGSKTGATRTLSRRRAASVCRRGQVRMIPSSRRARAGAPSSMSTWAACGLGLGCAWTCRPPLLAAPISSGLCHATFATLSTRHTFRTMWRRRIGSAGGGAADEADLHRASSWCRWWRCRERSPPLSCSRSCAATLRTAVATVCMSPPWRRGRWSWAGRSRATCASLIGRSPVAMLRSDSSRAAFYWRTRGRDSERWWP